MTQYDAIATPILNWDATPSNPEAYRAILPAEDIIVKRTVAMSPEAGLSKLSAKLDFVHPDSADPIVLNTILWKYARGLASKPPPPRHSPALAPAAHRSQSRAAKDKRRSARNDDDD